MKKTLIIALLVALVLGVFTACNGDVNAALMGKRTITLEIYNAGFTFKDGSRTIELSIPANCTTWKDLANTNSCKIEIKQGSSEAKEYTLILNIENGKVGFVDNVSGDAFVITANSSIPDIMDGSVEIAIGATFELIGIIG